MTVTDGQIMLFWELFTGRADAYGTYDPQTGRAWQVKEPVTAKVIRAHLQGQRPFGVYLLDGDRVHAIAADFDLAVSALLAWSRRNRPENGKDQLRPGEVRSQTRAASRRRSGDRDPPRIAMGGLTTALYTVECRPHGAVGSAPGGRSP